MNTKTLLWVMGGGIAAFFIIVALLIAIVFFALKDNKEPCVGSCKFVEDVRETGKYSDKSDFEVIEYGNEICTMLSSGEGDIVAALEDKRIINSANENLCPDEDR